MAAPRLSSGTAIEFHFQPSRALSPLAWLARVRGARVDVQCGLSVRVETTGFFEGSWAGPNELTAIPTATTVFGSGMVVADDELTIVPPSHLLEWTYLVRLPGELIAANSLVALLVGTGLELDPTCHYPPLFARLNEGIQQPFVELPTSGPPVTLVHFDNAVIAADGRLLRRAKPHEAPFLSFADYRDRLTALTASIFANAAGYEPLAAVSSGYDSAAAAAIAAVAGCRRAVTFRDGWAWRGFSGTSDSGEVTATTMGMSVRTADRLAYLSLDDAPEAEFLAAGMSGEDVVWRSIEDMLGRSILVTGYWGGMAWDLDSRTPVLAKIDQSGVSLSELRLRRDFIHLPLPYIGGTAQPSVAALNETPEMAPWRGVRPGYDKPVARRLAEQAGVPRSAFGWQKRAISQRLHLHGLAAMSASGRQRFEAFAGASTVARLPARPAFDRRHRAALRLARVLHVRPLVSRLERRRGRAVQLEPVLGTLLLRWAVAELRTRYASLLDSSVANESAIER